MNTRFINTQKRERAVTDSSSRASNSENDTNEGNINKASITNSSSSNMSCHHFRELWDLRAVLLFAGVGATCLLILYSLGNPQVLLLQYSSLSFSSNFINQASDHLDLDKVLEAASTEDKTVIFTPLNKAWAEPDSIFDIFLESFNVGNGTLKLLNHLVIVALDHTAYIWCRQIHPHCYALVTEGVDFSGDADFMTDTYQQMVWRKIYFLGMVLEKGYNFIFTDTDIVWFRDPFPRFSPDIDIQMACDFFNGNSSDIAHNSANTGLHYVKSNNRTIQFYKYWYNSRTKYPGVHDQEAFNRIKSDSFIHEIGLKIKLLDVTYFGGFCHPSRDLNLVCTMHANCCVGQDNKIHDLWILLDYWRKYMKSPSEAKELPPNWSEPLDCRDSIHFLHRDHHRHGNNLRNHVL